MPCRWGLVFDARVRSLCLWQMRMQYLSMAASALTACVYMASRHHLRRGALTRCLCDAFLGEPCVQALDSH